MKHKLRVLAIIGVGLNFHLAAQTPPTDNSPTLLNGNNSTQFWSRAGNLNSSGNNMFGTQTNFNSPVYHITNGAYRMKLNGDFAGASQYTINGFGPGNINTSGYLLLGAQGAVSGTPLYNNLGAFSLLHMNGSRGTFIQQFGFRPWMQTGITLTDNNDLSYFGLRALGGATTFDVTETTIAWSDNPLASGPDDMVLRFLNGTNTTGSSYNSNFSANSDLDGLHVARFTGTGRMGLGNTFGINVGSSLGYITPESIFHISNQFRNSSTDEYLGFMQVTYRRPFGAGSDIVGQGETAVDGLRLGIDNQIFNTGGASYLNGYLRWQETSSFIVQTDDGTPSNIEQNERLRITSIGALTNNYGSSYLGLSGPTNRTRIAISADGSNPITNPLSLLHLGYNTGRTNPGTDGWRPWMDLGIFTSNGTDNVYLGLKEETGFFGDRQDAVLSWGDDQHAAGGLPNGPDNFRMIFTALPFPPAGSTAPASGTEGLEGMRMTPTDSNGIFAGFGGDPSANLYGPLGTSKNPTATLEINSWETTLEPGGSSGLRFTNLQAGSPTLTNPGLGVLAVNKLGDVIYVPQVGNGLACWDVNGDGIQDASEDINGDSLWNTLDCAGVPGPVGPAGPSGTFADNGNSISLLDSATVVWGQDLGQPGNPAQLLNSREIPMNGYDVFFTDNGDNSANHFGIGTSTPGARLDVQMNGNSVGSPVALQVSQNSSSANVAVGGQISSSNQNLVNIGLITTGRDASLTNRGIIGQAFNGNSAIGGEFLAQNGSGSNQALVAKSSGGQSSIGITTKTTGGIQDNVGIDVEVHGNGSVRNVGFEGEVFGNLTGLNTCVDAKVKSPGLNYGVKSQAVGTGANDTYGLFSTATGSGRKFGLYAHASGTGMVYGVRTYVQGPGTRYGVMAEVDGGPGLKYAGWFSGANVYVNGNIVLTSDSTMKTNVAGIENASAILSQLNPVEFEYKQSGMYERMNMAEGQQYGLLAQEVEPILPALVQSNIFPAELDSLGNETAAEIPFKTLNYDGLIPFLIKGFQELQAQIDSIPAGGSSSCCDSLAMVVANQQDQIDALETENDQQQQTIDDLNARLSNLENCLAGLLPTLCQLSHSLIQENTPEAQELVRQQISVVLSNRNAIILDQNVPNPFAEQTVINFSIPETVVKAQIHFYSLEGKLMQSVDVQERGLGSLTVFGSDLSSGTYTYTLVADGKVVATKKMVKQ